MGNENSAATIGKPREVQGSSEEWIAVVIEVPDALKSRGDMLSRVLKLFTLHVVWLEHFSNRLRVVGLVKSERDSACRHMRRACWLSRMMLGLGESLLLMGVKTVVDDIKREHAKLVEILTVSFLKAITLSDEPQGDWLNDSVGYESEWYYRYNLIKRQERFEELGWPAQVHVARFETNVDSSCFLLHMRFAFFYADRRVRSIADEFLTERDKLSPENNKFHSDSIRNVAEFVGTLLKSYGDADGRHEPFVRLCHELIDNLTELANEALAVTDQAGLKKVVQRIRDVALVSRMISLELHSRPSFKSDEMKEYKLRILCHPTSHTELAKRGVVVAHCLNLDLVAAGYNEREALNALDRVISCWSNRFRELEDRNTVFPLVAPVSHQKCFEASIDKSRLEKMSGYNAAVVSVTGHPDIFR